MRTDQRIDQGTTVEMNFDGLVGPTHNYAGLAPGNLASQQHQLQVSNPRAAAEQGLAKMAMLHELGVPQAVLPPQPRPRVDVLRRFGFSGDDATVLYRAYRDAPELFAAVSSSASMWTANAATVCPSVDSGDGRVHFTPANLTASLHRAIETQTTARILRAAFPEGDCFTHHAPLPSLAAYGDEGAANHTRLADRFDQSGTHVFVYGTRPDTETKPKRFPARQTAAASRAVARLHGLDASRTVFLQQSPAAIDAGVFHNDVIAVGHRDLLFCHEHAFVDQSAALEEIRRVGSPGLRIVQVLESRVCLEDAVSTYLFNSQIVSDASDRRVLVAPANCFRHEGVSTYLQTLVAEKVFDQVVYAAVDQSMQNGGGPACLRLRVELNERERSQLAPGVVYDAALHAQLADWIGRYYPEHLVLHDLVDHRRLVACRDALDALTRILGLGEVYAFQRGEPEAHVLNAR